MSTPRTKRQFAGSSADPAQRQITSFFSSRFAGDGSSCSEEATAGCSHHSRQPLLPANVQANLLSVGMRIRKSVPEGYKTNGPSAFKLWTDNTPLPARATHNAPLRATARELLPFCGINKVGGLDTQPTLQDHADDNHYNDDRDQNSVPDVDSVPELTLSQESVDSNISEPSSRKRVYMENEADEEPTMLAPPGKGWDEQVSPRSTAPSQWGNSRALAVPRTRLKRGPPSFKSLDQENFSTVDDDFEEADFLVMGEGPDMDIS